MPKNVIVQGITGSHGAFHTKAMKEYGTHIVAGTSPKKAGEHIEGIPVYASIQDIKKDFSIDASVIFVPAPHAKAAILEAIDTKIPLIVCITERIPVHDMIAIHQKLRHSHSRLVGPNSPGIITPGASKLGIIPAHITLPGSVGVVSRSGTLTYEVVSELSRLGIGQRQVIGIGGDPIKGTDFIECLAEFEADSGTDAIVLIGEIGGVSEVHAAEYIAQSVTKPVFAYIAGHTAPAGVQMGHAGAILSSDDESAQAKSYALETAGVHVCDSITDIAPLIKTRYTNK
jgi:succinyl-CoA synthetase alpha subunit